MGQMNLCNKGDLIEKKAIRRQNRNQSDGD